MARSAQQWVSFGQLEWALNFAQTDLKTYDRNALNMLVSETGAFIGLANADYKSIGNAEKQFSSIQRGLRERLKELATLRPLKSTAYGGINDSPGSIMVVPDGSVQLIAFAGEPYRYKVQANSLEDRIYAALASHIAISGVVAGQIRICPECQRLFLLKLKPQPKRQFHCTIQCTNRATFKRFEAKRNKTLLAASKKELIAKRKELQKLVKSHIRRARNSRTDNTRS